MILIFHNKSIHFITVLYSSKLLISHKSTEVLANFFIYAFIFDFILMTYPFTLSLLYRTLSVNLLTLSSSLSSSFFFVSKKPLCVFA